MRKQLLLILSCALLCACNLPLKKIKTETTVMEQEPILVRDTEDTCVAAKIIYEEHTYNLTLQLSNVSVEYYPEDRVYLKIEVLMDAASDKIIYHLDPAELLPLKLELMKDKNVYVMPKLCTLNVNERSRYLTKAEHEYVRSKSKSNEELKLRVTLYDPWGYVLKSSVVSLENMPQNA